MRTATSVRTASRIFGARIGLGALLATAALLFPSPSAAYIGYGHDHDGWVKWTIYEQFNVRATEVYLRIGYYQDTWSVQNPTYRDGYCWHSDFPGWSIGRCDWVPEAVGYDHVGGTVRGGHRGTFWARLLSSY
jgi:hypothetical protein